MEINGNKLWKSATARLLIIRMRSVTDQSKVSGSGDAWGARRKIGPSRARWSPPLRGQPLVECPWRPSQLGVVEVFFSRSGAVTRAVQAGNDSSAATRAMSRVGQYPELTGVRRIAGYSDLQSGTICTFRYHSGTVQRKCNLSASETLLRSPDRPLLRFSSQWCFLFGRIWSKPPLPLPNAEKF